MEWIQSQNIHVHTPFVVIVITYTQTVERVNRRGSRFNGTKWERRKKKLKEIQCTARALIMRHLADFAEVQLASKKCVGSIRASFSLSLLWIFDGCLSANAGVCEHKWTVWFFFFSYSSSLRLMYQRAQHAAGVVCNRAQWARTQNERISFNLSVDQKQKKWLTK